MNEMQCLNGEMYRKVWLLLPVGKLEVLVPWAHIPSSCLGQICSQFIHFPGLGPAWWWLPALGMEH